jgi:hypothetical protein
MMEKINPKVSNLMNDKLLSPFSAEEVRKAMSSIGDYKAPGPDGLHAIFYKKFLWGGDYSRNSTSTQYRDYSGGVERYHHCSDPKDR